MATRGLQPWLVMDWRLPFRRVPVRADRYAADESTIALQRSGEQFLSKSSFANNKKIFR